MSKEDDNNINNIKEKLKKKRQNTDYVGYTAKKPEKEKTEGNLEKPPASKKNSKKAETEDDELSLKIEHYKDFEEKSTAIKNKKTPGKNRKQNVKSAGNKKSGGEKSADSSTKKKNSKGQKTKKPREKFKFKRVHLYIGIVIFLVLLLGVLLWYVFSSASDVKEINFEGNSLVTETELEERIGFSTGDKMFSISAGKAEDNVELLPVIEEVSVERDWPNNVTVNVNEYKAIAYITSEDLYFPVLENSRIQRGYPSAPRNAPIIYNFEGEEFDALVAALNEIEVDILESISEIYFRPTDNSMRRIHVFMNDGQEIVADYETFSEKMNYYIGIRQEIGDETGGIIDMEVGTSYLPYDSADAREIKDNIYNEPSQVGYIEDINEALDGVRSALGEIDNAAEE